MKTFIASFEFDAKDIDFATQDAFDILNRGRCSLLAMAVKMHAKKMPEAAADFERAADGMDALLETLKVEEKEVSDMKFEVGDFVRFANFRNPNHLVIKRITKIIVPLTDPKDRIIHIEHADGTKDWHRERYLEKCNVQDFQ